MTLTRWPCRMRTRFCARWARGKQEIHMGRLLLEVRIAVWLLNPVRGFRFKSLFVNAHEAGCRLFVLLFEVVLLAEPVTTHPPYGAFWRLDGSLDLVALCLTGVTHLVDGKGGYPLPFRRSSSNRDDILFRYDFLLAATAPFLNGWGNCSESNFVVRRHPIPVEKTRNMLALRYQRY